MTSSSWPCRLAAILFWPYLILLMAWLLAYVLVGDRNGYLGLVNLLAVYLFVPLPLALLSGLLCRRWGLLGAAGVGALAFAALWGPLFVPRLSPIPDGPRLRVLTFNVLAYHRRTEPILDVIRQSDADLVLLQELNPQLAQTLQTELAETYPYQVLDPTPNPTGIGTLSRFPLQRTGEDLSRTPQGLRLRWIGGPQVLQMDWQGQAVTVVNFHFLSTPSVRAEAAVAADFRQRAVQARALSALVERTSGPVILTGDANSVPISQVHRIMTNHLQDAWQTAGRGLGHTFPSRSTVPGSDRVKIGNWYAPPWLARIDYIFYTPHFDAIQTQLAPIDGFSDHRGVIADLVFRGIVER